MNHALRILVLLSGAVSLGCSGTIGGAESQSTDPGGASHDPSKPGKPGTPGNVGPGTGGPSDGTGGATSMTPPVVTPPGPLDDAKTVPGVAPLRRLTTLEYNNTIRDLLGITTTAGAKLTTDQGSS